LESDFEVEGVSYLAGDEVIDILKYEPVEQGSCTFVKTDKRFMVFVEDVRKTHIRVKSVTGGGESRIRATTRSRPGGPAGTERYVLSAADKAEILASVVPPGLEPEVLEKVAADAVLQSNTQTLLGHGIEVAFDVGLGDGPKAPTWCHGEICDVAADKIRVWYYSDNQRHWHRRFLMGHYGEKKSPLLVEAAAGAPALVGAMRLGQYHWRLLDGVA
jgi:hypothetical protein